MYLRTSFMTVDNLLNITLA